MGRSLELRQKDAQRSFLLLNPQLQARYIKKRGNPFTDEWRDRKSKKSRKKGAPGKINDVNKGGSIFKTNYTYSDFASTKKDAYYKYLKSEAWQKIREKLFEKYGKKCQRCGSSHDIQVHHRRYKRLFNEWYRDLEILCGKCHKEHHEHNQKRRVTKEEKRLGEIRANKMRAERVKAAQAIKASKELDKKFEQAICEYF